VGEGRQLVHHDVEGVLQLEDLALDVDGDLLGQVAVGDGGGDLGDVSHLAGQVGGHVVHRVGEVFPGPRDTFDLGLAAELAFGAHPDATLCRPVGEGRQLVHHDVEGVLQLEDLALDVDGDLLGQVTAGHGGGHLGDVSHLTGEV